MQLSHGYSKVGVIEVIVAVPSERSVHAPFADNCVEEGERQKQWLPDRLLRGGVVKLTIRLGVDHLAKCPHH